LKHPALLLVDLQRDFLDRPGLTPGVRELEGPISRVLHHARASGLPVGHVRTRVDPSGADRMPHWRLNDTWACVQGTPGEQAPSPFDHLPAEPVFYKQFFSGFSNPGLNAWLQDREVEEVWIVGIYTHGCVRATALDAYQLGFRVTIVADGVASTDPLHGWITRDYLDGRAARVTPSDELLGLAPVCDVHYRPDDPVEVAVSVRRSTRDEIHHVILSADGLAGDWATTPLSSRRNMVADFRHRLARAAPDLAGRISADLGKPLRDAQDELRRALGHVDAALRLDDSASIDGTAVVRYRPYGVVALVTPWNNPVAIPVGKLAAALLLGNAVVWKPAFQADNITREIRRLLQESGVPPDLVGIVNGGPQEVAQLVVHPVVAAVSLTGPESAGRAVAAICAPAGKPLQAELGGNNALLVLPGADLEEQAPAWARHAFGFAGQRCTALRRFVVHRAVLGEFERAFTRAVRSLKVSCDSSRDRDVGPLISAAQLARVEATVGQAIPRGARVLTGGNRPAGVGGHCFEPTVVAGLAGDDPLVQEELFGPVAVIQVAENFEHGLALVNGVRQGLLAGITGGTREQQEDFVRRAQAGILLDGGGMIIHPDAPFGGCKASQIGPPEHGVWDRQFFTRVQVVYRRDTPR